ncbi:hypothetical protein [Canibacter oris]|uniref:SdpC family antimicrobial peptide n=1 Tax=Canibacter oris TaxID=1365628 RepID=A0A840DIP2_9MICO|nr:hypothetical protein [Canibacter oris]MBB4071352.1 SdpC family antimicrobial peptide [Canibacter oris]
MITTFSKLISTLLTLCLLSVVAINSLSSPGKANQNINYSDSEIITAVIFQRGVLSEAIDYGVNIEDFLSAEQLERYEAFEKHVVNTLLTQESESTSESIMKIRSGNPYVVAEGIKALHSSTLDIVKEDLKHMSMNQETYPSCGFAAVCAVVSVAFAALGAAIFAVVGNLVVGYNIAFNQNGIGKNTEDPFYDDKYSLSENEFVKRLTEALN